MKAAFYQRRGDPSTVLQVGARPVPVPGDGELLVRVAYSAVHPADVKRRAGLLGNDTYDEIIPHSDGSGTVVAVGSGIMPAEWLNQDVWVYNAQRGRPFGTAAEYVALPVGQCRRVVGGYGLRDVGGIGIPMLCSHAAVFHCGPVQDKTVLVTGAAGAVGRNAVQWARWGGARRIVAVVRDDRQAALARQLGAHESLVLCPGEAMPDSTLASVDAVDLVVDVDIGRNAPWVPQTLAQFGVWSAFASSSAITLDFRSLTNRNAGIRFIQTHSLAQHELDRALLDIDRIHADRAVVHQNGPVFPLDDIAQAHALVEQGRAASTVLISITESATCQS